MVKKLPLNILQVLITVSYLVINLLLRKQKIAFRLKVIMIMSQRHHQRILKMKQFIIIFQKQVLRMAM